MTLVTASKKIALLVGLVLLAVGSYAAYTKYTKSQLPKFGVGQTKAWIFGSGPYSGIAIETTPTSIMNQALQLTPEELARFPTVKAYIDYVDSNPGRTPLGSMSIDPSEARSLLLLLTQKTSYEMKPQTGSMLDEWYSFNLDVSGTGYGINIIFSDERPVLD